MIYLSKKKIILIGTLVIITTIIIIQLVFNKEDPPVFVEVEPMVQAPQDNVTVQSEEMFVDVKGEVANPGVYQMNKGDRIQDAIDKAGGTLIEADLNQINLAIKVYDEMLIYVPKKGENYQQRILEINDGKISINQATVSELTKLAGIGEQKATAIIQYREEHGSFKSIEELMKVPGIKEATFNQIKNDITTH